MRVPLLWLAAGLMLVAIAPGPGRAAEELVDGIAAQVGNHIVLVSEVKAKVAETENRMIAAGAPEAELYKLRADGLERMIEEKILQNEVRRLELSATDAEIDQVIEVLAADNGITLGQLEDSVRSQGMTMEEYRGEIRTKVEQRKVMTQALQPRVVIEEAEVRKMYDERFSDQPAGGMQVHLRHLLIPATPERSLDTACEEMDTAAARIRAGEAFEVVASEMSVVSPTNGGDIGWLHSDSLAGWMSDLVEAIDPGEVSAISRQPFGCNMLKLVERTRYEPVTFEQARERLEQALYAQKIEIEYAAWMEDLRKHTYIKRRGYFAEAANLDAIPETTDPLADESLLQ